MPDVVHTHEIVINGGGLTGLMAAISAVDRGKDVAVVSKVHPLRSHSVAAQGGITPRSAITGPRGTTAGKRIRWTR